MFKNSCLKWGFILAVFLVLIVGIYFIPPVYERLSWRLDNLRAKVIYALHPPEDVVFVPENPSTPTLSAIEITAVTPIQALPPSSTPPSPASLTPSVTATATTIPTPIPEQVSLKGAVHEYQKWNNCGPANLAMLLSYWGWQGTQIDTAALH